MAARAYKRPITTAILLGMGLSLASCGGFVADHWPHWAGGMPQDVPPRPGAPGYEDFISRGQAKPDVKQDIKADGLTAASPQNRAAAVPNGAPESPAAQAPLAPAAVRTAIPDNGALQDSSVVNGGLY